MTDLLSPPGPRPGQQDLSPLSSPFSNPNASPIAARRTSLEERRRPAAHFDRLLSPRLSSHANEARKGGDNEDDRDDSEDVDDDDDGDLADEDDGDEMDYGELSPLLPIFSAEHLDSLPVYNITHTIRLLIIPRCETTLSWDQLRSPQVSQFLVKPIQQQIKTSHFSKATLYALLANCLQFNKEVQTNPGNSGVSKTRATLCELLAMRLLKEFSTRELIGQFCYLLCSDLIMCFEAYQVVDALSYDFYPLQGLPTSSGTATPGPNWDQRAKSQPRVARISTLEVAIRAQAKRLLAHPLVVQQLEAIWAGTIVFHATADNLHRSPVKITPNQNRGYGALSSGAPILRAGQDDLQPAKQRDHLEPTAFVVRRSVTLYDPKQASLFKLSRLRVPRYRQVLSTLSFAVLLGLYVAVLVERSLSITPLEVIFWIWSAGFMLDEIVGFNEQGFSLYILSFWNTFDVGILLLLVCYYFMRLYGILMPDIRKHRVADMAYDLLAANAVLLFPRLFSVLDHYRYFSQLLIAFRMMAQDLVAVFVLIVITCSGFFVAFTLSFGTDDYNGASVAYALFQMLMGFTPAAWDIWGTYNILGKAILVLFLFICHFLIVTILITVLTNSFMAIVQNANEEHQFVFAVNAISMVKSDALFSYVAPTNVIAWALAPLRYIVPFKQFVRTNRTVIKATHFPILLIIYAYERLILHGTLFEPTDLVEGRGRFGQGITAFEGPVVKLSVLSPKQNRLREPSVATFHKDRALDEVFRRPFRDNTIRGTAKSRERRQTSNVVNHWMQNMGPDGTASPPMEQDRSIVDRLEARGVARRRSRMTLQSRRGRQGTLGRDFTEATISVVSDPEDFVASDARHKRLSFGREASGIGPAFRQDLPTQTETEEDVELSEHRVAIQVASPRLESTALGTVKKSNLPHVKAEDYFQGVSTPQKKESAHEHVPRKVSPPKQVAIIKTTTPTTPAKKVKHHTRMASNATILYDPPKPADSSESSNSPVRKVVTARNSAHNTGTVTPNNPSTSFSAGRRTPKRRTDAPVTVIKAVPRPIMPPRSAFQSAPNLAGMLAQNAQDRRRSSFTMDIASDLGDNKAAGGGGFVGGVPASFATQLAFATKGMRIRQKQKQKQKQKQRHRLSRDLKHGQPFNDGDEEQDDDEDDVLHEDDDNDDDDTGASNRISKLMLARMNTLEEGFREVIREVKEMRKGTGPPR